jgi:hypothetical protein
MDNYSTDDTAKIALSYGRVEVRKFGNPNFLDNEILMQSKNNCWKSGIGDWDVDWVQIVDADEILQITRRDLQAELEAGTTIIRTRGYSMHSRILPERHWYDIKMGKPDDNYSKLACFNPNAITGINYNHGAHKADPKGEVKFSNDTYSLLHYKFVGDPMRMVHRHIQNARRRSDRDKRLGLSVHYDGDQSRLIREWDQWISQCANVVDGGHNAFPITTPLDN